MGQAWKASQRRSPSGLAFLALFSSIAEGYSTFKTASMSPGPALISGKTLGRDGRIGLVKWSALSSPINTLVNAWDIGTTGAMDLDSGSHR